MRKEEIIAELKRIAESTLCMCTVHVAKSLIDDVINNSHTRMAVAFIYEETR